MRGEGALGRRRRGIGWFCFACTAIVVLDLLLMLPTMPAKWWTPPEPVTLASTSPEWDLRIMYVDFGLGSFAWWGYALSVFWIPLAALRAYRSTRVGLAMALEEWILVVGLVVLASLPSAIVRLTPLKYAHLNILVP